MSSTFKGPQKKGTEVFIPKPDSKPPVLGVQDRAEPR